MAKLFKGVFFENVLIKLINMRKNCYFSFILHSNVSRGHDYGRGWPNGQLI